MKIRNGFVSNSSSSSFVVVFKKRPKTKEELQTLLFADDKIYKNPYTHGDNPKSWAVEEVVEVVWKDLKEQKKSLSLKKVAQEFSQGWLCDKELEALDRHFDKIDREKGYEEIRFDKKHFVREIIAKKVAKEFCEQYKGNKFFRFEYADEDRSLDSAMEHGTLFDRVPHKRISHH